MYDIGWENPLPPHHVTVGHVDEVFEWSKEVDFILLNSDVKYLSEISRLCSNTLTHSHTFLHSHALTNKRARALTLTHALTFTHTHTHTYHSLINSTDDARGRVIERAGMLPLYWWHRGFELGEWTFVSCVLCIPTAASATSWSLIQRSTTGCVCVCVCVCVTLIVCDHEKQ
jgi:hypothetical protein